MRSRKPAWCYVHAGPGVAQFLRVAREQGSKILLDVSHNEINQAPADVLECIPLADVFTPNRAELLHLTGAASLEAAVTTAAAGARPRSSRWARTARWCRGPDGVVPVTEGVTPVEVADLTGAGDSFAGALIGELLRGAPLVRAVAAANAAGSAAARRLGAVGPVQVEGLSTVLPLVTSLLEAHK